MKIGDLVLLKQGLKLVRAVVISVDLTYVTLRLDYKQGFGADIKLDINSEDIIKPSGLHVDGFDYKDDIGFFRAWCRMRKDRRYRVNITNNDEIITISVEDIVSKMKQIKSFQKSSLINIDININIFLQNEIEKLKNKLKKSSQNND